MSNSRLVFFAMLTGSCNDFSRQARDPTALNLGRARWTQLSTSLGIALLLPLLPSSQSYGRKTKPMCVKKFRDSTALLDDHRKMRRQELEELFTVWQAKLLDPLDRRRWTDVLNTTVASLLSSQPLQRLTKRGRLAVVMCIVGSARTSLFSPTVLAVLACDWSDEFGSLKLLQDTVRQAALAHIRSECPTPPNQWSRNRIADFLEEGVQSTSGGCWRALGIKGSARERVEKTSREMRGLAARCRGACDRSAARKLLGCYLDSNRLEGFIKALVSWGQEQLRASEPSVFDEAFPFLEKRQIQASRLHAGQMQAGFELLEKTQESPDAKQQSQAVSSALDTEGDQENRGRGDERSTRKRRKLGFLHLDEIVLVRRKSISDRATNLWRSGAIDRCRGDGTYDVAYDDGQVDHLVRRADILGAEGIYLPWGTINTTQVSASDLSPLPPSSEVSVEQAAAMDELWCVTDVDDDFDAPRKGGNRSRLLAERRSRMRRVLEDDESPVSHSTARASDSPPSRITDAAVSCTDEDKLVNLGGVADSKARQQEKREGEQQEEEEEVLRDRCARQEVGPGSPILDEASTMVVDEDEVETDEELTGTHEKTRIHRIEQSNQQPPENEVQGGGDDLEANRDKTAGDGPVNRAQPLVEKPSEGRPKDPNDERHDNESSTKGLLSLTEEDHASAGGMQATPVQDDEQETRSQQSNEPSRRDEQRKNAVVDDDVVRSPLGKIPEYSTNFMRVYGSSGIARVRKLGMWFSQRQPTCES